MPVNKYSPAQSELLELMGVQVWTPRSEQTPPSGEPETATLAPDPAAEPAEPHTPAPAPTTVADGPELEALRSKVAACTACPLHAGRRQTVFGTGNPQADWMFVGEGPGEQEDRRGEPFVGRAGKLLDAMLKAMKLDRTTVYIANIVKCRPPNNRNPSQEEAATCIPYLKRQIELIAPRLIVALGAVAAHRLLETDRAVGALRGKLHYTAQPACPVLVTYHPAYLLRSPGQKSRAWEDLQLAMREMEAMRRKQDAS